MADIIPDSGQAAVSGLLDKVLGTANSAVDLWGKWSGAKADAVATKAAVPTTAVQQTPPVSVATGSAISQKQLMIGGAVLLALGLAFAFFTRSRK